MSAPAPKLVALADRLIEHVRTIDDAIAIAPALGFSLVMTWYVVAQPGWAVPNGKSRSAITKSSVTVIWLKTPRGRALVMVRAGDGVPV